MEIKEIYNLYNTCSGVSTDTRNIEKNTLFFALKGENFNANEFAEEAINLGAKYAIIDDKKYQKTNQFIVVDDALSTLQELAKYHRTQLSIPIIGITGTNGKTTTKELINAVLNTQFKTGATKGNLNNHIGVPLTLLSITHEYEIAIIEMGANHIGEIAFLCNICSPDLGIITNIGTAHIEGFGSAEGVKKTKKELYDFIESKEGLLFVNNDDELLTKLSSNIQKITYGTHDTNCNANLIQSTPNIKLDWNKHIFNSPLYGSYNFENILAAICIGQHFGIDDEKIINAIENYSPKNNRSQLLQIESNTIYLDAYNANPTSMNAAIDTFASNTSTNKLMILGDMLELGTISKEEHQKIIDKVNALNIESVFVGSHFSLSNNQYDLVYLKNVDEVIDWLKHAGKINYQILIKGSRGIRLEKIAEYLQKKEVN